MGKHQAGDKMNIRLLIFTLLIVSPTLAATLVEHFADYSVAGTVAIGDVGGVEYSDMQRFTIDAGECFDTVQINYYKGPNAPSGDVYVRIETLAGTQNFPSGTLVHADAWAKEAGTVDTTTTRTSNFTLGRRLCEGIELTAGTKYAIVFNATAQAANDYWVLHQNGSAGYRGGTGYATAYNDGVWNNQSIDDSMDLWDVTGTGAAPFSFTMTITTKASLNESEIAGALDYLYNVTYNSTLINSLTADNFYFNGNTPSGGVGCSSPSGPGENKTVTCTPNQVVTAPMVATNGTNYTTYWNYTIRYANYTNTTVSTTEANTSIYYGFYFPNYYPDTDILWGDTIHFYAAPYTQTAANLKNVTVDFDSATYNLTYSAGVWGSSTTAPEPSAASETWTSNATLTASVTGGAYSPVTTTTETRTSENESITVYKATLALCSAIANQTSINFTFYNEEEVTAPVASNMDLTVWIYPDAAHTVNVTTSFNFTDVYNATLCIYPTWATVYVDTWQAYWGNETSNDSPRAYFLDDAELDNSTEEVSLYVLNDTYATLIAVSVADTDATPVTGAYVYFARYYPAENVYRTVSMIRTDDFGAGSTYLRPNDIWYRFTITKDGTTLGTFSPQTVACDPAELICNLYLTLAPDTWLEYISYYDQFSYACAFNATGTNATVCSYADASGLMKYARLQVWKTGLFSPTSVCDTSLTTASGSLTCPLGNVSGQYVYTLSAHFADEITLYQDELDYSGTSSALFGTTGLIAGAFVFLMAALAGAHSAGAVLIMGTVGLIAAQLIGLLGLAPSALVGFAVVAFAIFIKIKGGAR